jgi:hypothetical protein
VKRCFSSSSRTGREYRRERQMGLGPLYTVGLAEAREMARQARLLVKQGKGPSGRKECGARRPRGGSSQPADLCRSRRGLSPKKRGQLEKRNAQGPIVLVGVLVEDDAGGLPRQQPCQLRLATPSTPTTTASPSMVNDLARSLPAAAAIAG